jgi:DNA polymerase-3 subunit beta
MKLQVLQEELVKNINIAQRFTSGRAQLPVLGNVMLEASGNKLYISATNLENSIYTSIGAKVEKDGEITVPVKILYDLISNLDSGNVELSSEKEVLEVLSGNFSSKITGVNTSDFPSIPKRIDKESLNLPFNLFKDSLNKILFSVSNDETRPILTGVLMLFKKNAVVFVSTDGFRLSKKMLGGKGVASESKLIVPKGILTEIARLETENEDILISTKDGQVVFKVGSMILSSRVIEGDFPDYEKIIPKSSDIKINIDKQDFLRGIKLASVFARDSANIVKLVIENDGVVLNAESQAHGNQKNKVDAKVESSVKSAPLLEIAYNFRFIEEFLQIVTSDVEITFTNSNSPGVFNDLSDSDLLHLIMPVRLQS